MSKTNALKNHDVTDGYYAIPVAVYSGDVVIRKIEKLNPLSKIILKFAYFHPNVKDLLKSLDLNPKIIQDTIIDLFYQNLIYLDFYRGRVSLCEEIASMIRNNALDEYLNMDKIKTVTKKWIQEQISGVILDESVLRNFPLPERTEKIETIRAGPIGSIIGFPELSDMAKIKAIQEIEKTNAYNESFSLSGEDQEFIEKITNIKFVENASFFIPYTLVLMEGHPYPVARLDSRGLPPHFIENLKVKVKDYLPKGYETFSDVSISIFEESTTFSLFKRLWNFREEILKLKKISNNDSKYVPVQKKIMRLQKEFDFRISSTLNILSELVKSVNEVYVEFGSPDAHLALIDDKLKLAKDFVIIGSAFLNGRSLKGLAPIISRTLRQKGIKVIFLWGRIEELQTEQDRDILEDFYTDTEFPVWWKDESNFYLIKSSSPFHSKFISIDGMSGIISSLNFLSNGYTGNSREISAFFSGGKCPIELLEYALEHIGTEENVYEDLRKHLQENTTLISKNTELSRNDLCNRIKELIEGFEVSFTAFLMSKTRKSFEKILRLDEEWYALIKEIKKIPICKLIRDSSHRNFLIDAVHNMKEELIICTDRIRDEGISPLLVKEINDKLEEGRMIRIKWGRESPNTPLSKELKYCIKTIQELNSKTNDKIDIKENPENIHAKCINLDSKISLISSFNFLSLGKIENRERFLSGELGIVINSKKIGQQLNLALQNSSE